MARPTSPRNSPGTRLLLAGVLGLLAASPARALSDDAQRQLDAFQDAANQKAKEAVQARIAWMAAPTFAKQNQFNRLRSQAQTLFKDYEQALDAAIAAENANSWFTQAKQTAEGTIATIGGAISDAATRLFGAADEDVFGANWQQINAQFDAMSQKYRDILARKKAALAKPDNDAEVQAILKEIEGMRKRYDILRVAIRAEQRNVGFLATFWGEDYMGRYIGACVEGFDFTAVLTDVLTGNIKLIYDVFKPALLLKIGEWIGPNCPHLTAKIKDAVITDILGAGPDQPDEAADFVKGQLSVEKYKAYVQSSYKKVMAQQFDRLKQPLMRNVQAKIEREMSDEYLLHMRGVPYEKLPGAPTASYADEAASYFNNKAVRDKYMAKTEEGIRSEVQKVAGMNKAGYVASKVESLTSKIENVGVAFDFASEFVSIYANSGILQAALLAADGMADKIGQDYDKNVDKTEIPRDEYINKVFFGEWKMVSAAGNSAASKAQAQTADNISATAPLKLEADLEAKEKKKAEEEAKPDAAEGPVEPVPNVVEDYSKLLDGLEKQLDAGTMDPQELLRTEQQAFADGTAALDAVRAYNEASFDHGFDRISQAYSGCHDPSCSKVIDAEFAKLKEDFKGYTLTKKWLSMYGNASVDYTGMANHDCPTEWAKNSLEAQRRAKYKEWWQKGDKALQDLKGELSRYGPLQAPVDAAIGNGRITDDTLTCYSERAAVQSGDPRQLKLGDPGLRDRSAAVAALSRCEKGAEQVLPGMIANAAALADEFASRQGALLDEMAESGKKEGAWADLILSRSFYYAGGGAEIFPVADEDKTSGRVYDSLLTAGQHVLETLESWRSEAQGLLEKDDSAGLDRWSSDVEAYRAAAMKYVELTGKIDAQASEHGADLSRLVPPAAVVLRGRQDGLKDSPQNTLAYLSSQFSSGARAVYAPPSVKLASWIIQAQHTADGLKRSADDVLHPDALRRALMDDQEQYDRLIEANQTFEDLQPVIVNGYKALSGPFPGFDGALDSLPSDVRFYNVSYDSVSSDLALLRRLDNLYRGLSELPGALAARHRIQDAYLQAVKGYYQALLKTDAAEFAEVGKLLDQSKPEEAEKRLKAIGSLYPAYPDLTEGVILDDGVKPEKLGFADALAADQTKKNQLSLRIAQMRSGSVDEQAQAAIQGFYRQFKQAYEARDDSRVMSCIDDHWSAGDGTTLADLQENLRNSFGVFDSIVFDLQNLSVQKQMGADSGTFTASYDLTITSRNFRDNLTHQEKSSVSESVQVGPSGKVKIVTTQSGRFWYIR